MSVTTISQDTTVQQLSIHQLSVRKVCRYFSVQEASAEFIDLITKVVDFYNRTRKENSYTQIGQQNGLSHFQLLIYAQVNHSQSRLARWVQDLGCEEDLTTKRVHYLFFFYRQIQVKEKETKEIFALTSGQAWRVVQKFSDYQFPPKIARRLFSPEILSSKNRPLVGGVLTYSEILKQGATVSDAAAVDRVFTRIKFKFREDASIFQLSCLQNKKGEPLLRGANAEIGLGLVRLGKDINPKNYPVLLNHFAVISRGGTTHCLNTDKTDVPEVEKDSDEFDFLDYLHPVDFAIIPQLEKTLVGIVYRSVVKNAPFPPLDFCPKNLNDYFCGTDHQLRYDKKSVDCPNSFRASQMVELLKRFTALVNAETEEAFSKALTKVSVSFSFQEKREEAPFTDYIEGEFRLPNGDVYWRLHTMWYEVRADYLGLIHQEFGKLVEKNLIGDKGPGSLQHLWPSPIDKEKRKIHLQKAHEEVCKVFNEKKKCEHKVRYDIEAEYNQTYLSEKSFLLGDKICPQGIELFDLLHYTQKHLYLYHVKEEFGQKTRDACSQIFNAAQLLHTLKHRSASNMVAEFYKEAVDYGGKEGYRIQVREKIKALGKDKFYKLFSKKIIFVYAFVDTSTKKEPRLLAKDKGLKTRITPADISDANARFKKKGEEIFSALVKERYLTAKGHLTSKFFVASADTFTLEILTVANQRATLYQRLSTFGSQFDSTIAKLELLRLDRELNNLGFQLRICQIRRTDYLQDAQSKAAAEPEKNYAWVDALAELDDIELGLLREDLSEEHDFTHGNESFHICTTRGDGACGLHALLGAEKEGEYVYNAPDPNKDVRERFATALQTQYDEVQSIQNEYIVCLIGLLKDYLEPAPSEYVKRVFDSIKDQMKELLEAIEIFSEQETELKETQEEQFEAALNVDEITQANLEKQLEASLDTLRNDSYRRNNAFRNNLNGVITALEGTAHGTAISQTQEALIQLNQQRDVLYEAFVKKPEVFNAYIAACKKRDYYFSEREIGLAAHLFNKRAVIYVYRHLDQVFDPMEYGDPANDKIVIFHKDRHFSHCEKNVE